MVLTQLHMFVIVTFSIIYILFYSNQLIRSIATVTQISSNGCILAIKKYKNTKNLWIMSIYNKVAIDDCFAGLFLGDFCLIPVF